MATWAISATISEIMQAKLNAARCYASAAYAIMQCLSICHVREFCQHEYLQNFSQSGSQTILVFPHQTLWQYSDRDPLMNAGGLGDFSQ